MVPRAKRVSYWLGKILMVILVVSSLTNAVVFATMIKDLDSTPGMFAG